MEEPKQAWVGRRPGVEYGLVACVRSPSTTEHVQLDPSRSAVNCVLHEHLDTFLTRSANEHGGRDLPAHAKRELCAAITCGDFAHGFSGVGCPDCALDLLVASSCRGRGFCPSWCGPRMAEFAGHGPFGSAMRAHR